MKPILLLTNCPDIDVARKIVAVLLENKLIAAANILAEIESHYVWEGERVQRNEVPLMLKTCDALVPEIEARIRQLHPYQTPAIIAQDIAYANADYFRWVMEHTSAET